MLSFILAYPLCCNLPSYISYLVSLKHHEISILVTWKSFVVQPNLKLRILIPAILFYNPNLKTQNVFRDFIWWKSGVNYFRVKTKIIIDKRTESLNVYNCLTSETPSLSLQVILMLNSVLLHCSQAKLWYYQVFTPMKLLKAASFVHHHHSASATKLTVGEASENYARLEQKPLSLMPKL